MSTSMGPQSHASTTLHPNVRVTGHHGSSEELDWGCCLYFFRYRTCGPNQYLVKTGMGVKDIEYDKRMVHWPFQRVHRVDMNPRNFNFHMNNMSAEMVPFNLPVVFTIGPVDPVRDKELFLVYCRRMSGLTEAELGDVVAGVVHGQTRVFSASLTIREMFEDRDKFKHTVQERVQKDLNQYGLYIYNANIAEMRDMDDSNKYFEKLKQKALEGANTEARIQVAEARKLGDIGEKQRQGDTKAMVANIDADVTKAENLRKEDIERSNLQLQLIRTQCKQTDDTARLAAEFIVKQKQVELQTDFAKSSALQQVEQLRAAEMSKAVVNAETAIKLAEGKAEATRRTADAELYQEQKKADAVLYQQMKKAEAAIAMADADLYREQKQAQAIQTKREAQAEGIKSILQALGSPELAMRYVNLDHGLYDRMAAQTAAALQGLNPKINIWSQGAGAGENGVAEQGLSTLRHLFTNLPPMLDAIQQQTDIKMPSWLPQAPAETATK